MCFFWYLNLFSLEKKTFLGNLVLIKEYKTKLKNTYQKCKAKLKYTN